MGRKKTTRNGTKSKTETTSTPGKIQAAPPGKPPAENSELSPSEALAVLRECGAHLDGPPEVLKLWIAPIPPGIKTVRELVMQSMLKIRDKRGHLLRLRLNRAQHDLQRTSGKRNIVLKARQLGVTTYVAARFFVSCITREGTLSVQVAHDQRSAEEIFRIVHRLLENLPESLRQGALVTSRANVRQIVFPMLDSEYRVETAADPNAGRGLTIHNLHCSEVARWPRDVSETLASLRAAVPPEGEIFLESTPNGAGGTFYDEWQRAAQTGYVRHFYPWWWDPNYRRKVDIVDFGDQERELMHKHNLDAGQIAFRREMRANFGNRAPEEYAEDPESCFLASGDCVFDCDILDERLKQPPVISESTDNGKLLTFFPPVGGGLGVTPKEYIIGVDPAGGGCDGDYACAQVIERSTGLQCAELRGHFTPQELAARVAVLGRKYNQALVAVERNNHGHAVIAHLAMSAGYQNLYPGGAPPGWLTTAASRPRMLENFAAVLSSASFLFLSPRLLQECRTFIRHQDGTSAAAGGAHDDTVMAMAIALAVRAEVVVRPPQSMHECNFAILQTA